MEEELRSATNKYARVNIIRKYMNAYSDYIMIGNKQYDIDTGTYTNTFYKMKWCFTCNEKCVEGKWGWEHVQKNENYFVEYRRCELCISKKIYMCILCCMPKSMCIKAKVTTILILRQHLHRDIIPIILNKIHG